MRILPPLGACSAAAVVQFRLRRLFGAGIPEGRMTIMARVVQIEYPLAYDDFSDCSRKQTTVHGNSFVAWGTHTGVYNDFQVQLRRNKCDKEPILGGLIAFQAFHWIAVFDNPKHDLVPSGEGYILEVRLGFGGRLLASREGIKVQGDYGIGIQYPLSSDSPVPTNFHAWGTTTNPQCTVSAFMQQGNGPPIPGTVLQQVHPATQPPLPPPARSDDLDHRIHGACGQQLHAERHRQLWRPSSNNIGPYCGMNRLTCPCST